MATEPAKSENPVARFIGQIEARERDLRESLEGSGITAAQFLRAAKTAIRMNLDLAATDFGSFWNACLRACRDGLLPDGVEGAIVPYKTSATWIPMYQGKVRQFRRSGKFKWIGAEVVREGETFTHYTDETGPHFRHEPRGDGTAKIVSVYAAATSIDGGFFLEVLSMRDIEKARAMSRAKADEAPWQKWPEEMMKKTALHRLSKLLPSARDAIEDESDDDIAQLETINVTPTNPKPRLITQGSNAMEHFASSTPEAVSAKEPVEAPVQEAPAGSAAKKHRDAADEYFEDAEAMITEMNDNNEGDTAQAKLWFGSEAQRKVRREKGISVDASVKFHERMFGKQ